MLSPLPLEARFRIRSLEFFPVRCVLSFVTRGALYTLRSHEAVIGTTGTSTYLKALTTTISTNEVCKKIRRLPAR